jgi:hypothetical protein
MIRNTDRNNMGCWSSTKGTDWLPSHDEFSIGFFTCFDDKSKIDLDPVKGGQCSGGSILKPGEKNKL